MQTIHIPSASMEDLAELAMRYPVTLDRVSIDRRLHDRWLARLDARRCPSHWYRWCINASSPADALRGVAARVDTPGWDAFVALSWLLAEDAPSFLPALVASFVDNTKSTRLLEVLEQVFTSAEWLGREWQSEQLPG